MTSLHTTNKDLNHHPIDIVEQLAEFNEWNFDRRSDEEVAVQVPGSWCDYSLHFAGIAIWSHTHFTCAFDIRVSAIKKARVELLALINEKLWLGHFIVWSDEGLLVFVLPFL